MDSTEIRVILAVAGVLVLALIYLFGRPRRPGQGKRKLSLGEGGERLEPSLGDVTDPDAMPAQGELDVGIQAELDKLGSAIAEKRSTAATPPPVRKGPLPGVRPTTQPVTRWPELALTWMRDRGFLEAGKP